METTVDRSWWWLVPNASVESEVRGEGDRLPNVLSSLNSWFSARMLSASCSLVLWTYRAGAVGGGEEDAFAGGRGTAANGAALAKIPAFFFDTSRVPD